uniref:Uncharacterized protein n=1 Tax=Vespula pensylvanica TaxID=30213 RepID=A0A834P9N7_VESPE|nr:hypothetical protein H0235_002445 [Vespula pensylvanica]
MGKLSRLIKYITLILKHILCDQGPFVVRSRHRIEFRFYCFELRNLNSVRIEHREEIENHRGDRRKSLSTDESEFNKVSPEWNPICQPAEKQSCKSRDALGGIVKRAAIFPPRWPMSNSSNRRKIYGDTKA